MVPVRIMLKEGEDRFRDYIHKLKADPSSQKPDLNTDPFSQEFYPQIFIDETKIFNTKLELARYLDECFKKACVKREDIIEKSGLWTWLAYIWFELLTNYHKNILKRKEHYICTTPSNYRRYYIHLVAAPYIVYSLHGLPVSKIFLYNPPWELNDITERVAPNQFLISHKNIVEAIYRLYFDENQGKPKRKTNSKNAKGNLRRFIKVFQQIESTYDLYSMTPDQIIDLLPPEFDSWKK